MFKLLLGLVLHPWLRLSIFKKLVSWMSFPETLTYAAWVMAPIITRRFEVFYYMNTHQNHLNFLSSPCCCGWSGNRAHNLFNPFELKISLPLLIQWDLWRAFFRFAELLIESILSLRFQCCVLNQSTTSGLVLSELFAIFSSRLFWLWCIILICLHYIRDWFSSLLQSGYFCSSALIMFWFYF